MEDGGILRSSTFPSEVPTFRAVQALTPILDVDSERTFLAAMDFEPSHCFTGSRMIADFDLRAKDFHL